MNKIEIGRCINCCVYLMCQPIPVKMIPSMPITLKTKYSAYLISLTVPSIGKSLFVRSRNN